MELMHTPGETNDQITVWLPDDRIVLPGDNIYKAFPNLYAIRGSAPRDAVKWYNSLEMVRELDAKYMVPSHTRPVRTVEAIYDVLTKYRDAIQFVHDQTVRHINFGTRLDDMVSVIKLPRALRQEPYLKEKYGTMEWSIRGVYEFYMGWFDEDPVSLYPLSKHQEARMLRRMLEKNFLPNENGLERMLIEAGKSLEVAQAAPAEEAWLELRWALKLSSLVELDCAREWIHCRQAKAIKVTAMTRLAARTENSNARNYYLTFATELSDKYVPKERTTARSGFIKKAHIETLMNQLPINFVPAKCHLATEGVIEFDMGTEEERIYSVVVRNCIVQLHRVAVRPEAYDILLKMSSETWRQLLITPWITAFTGQIEYEGGSFFDYYGFLGRFRTT